ncbi:MAG TPA: serine/threonine-protein kinase, partial [Kofleriaceae bacterium]|nr:serine/threonine-protein kinase [Kofleriaceae bacterium]
MRGAQIGRYLILDEVGRGGMGVVYAAYDPDLDRKVALKLLPGATADRARRNRLLREAQSMAKLSHANVVTVFEVGTAGTRDYVAMEFVDGPNLAQWVAARRPEAERGKDAARAYVSAAMALFVEAGRGLAAAHRAGIVHRDLKPANILIGEDGRARVGDFGLAREVGAAEVGLAVGAGPVARTSAGFGTPAYMAPEQFRGEPADERADQFSFCVAL